MSLVMVSVVVRSEQDAGKGKRSVRVLPANRSIYGARSAGLEPATFSVRSHSPSGTRADTEGQGETKQRFYQVLALLEGHRGTGRDTRLRSDCGQTLAAC